MILGDIIVDYTETALSMYGTLYVLRVSWSMPMTLVL